MANLISVHCTQRSRDIWDPLQNYFLFIQLCNQSKFFCIVSFIWQLEGCGRCVSMKQKEGEERTQYWYSIKTDVQCFVCQVLARLFALKAIQRGSKQMAGRSCLCYFWTFPLKVSDCCPFSPFPHSCMFFFLPSFPLSFLRTLLFFQVYIINHTTSPKSWVCF